MSQVGPRCAPSAPSCVGSACCERVDSFSFSVFRLSSSLCCLVLRFFSFILGRLVVKYKEISPCLSAAYLVRLCVCVCVCVWHGAIAHYANYLHEFSILVKRFGALLGHKGEKLGISRNMIKMTFDGDDERNLNPAQIDLSEAN